MRRIVTTLAELIAALASGLFAGAAVYINLVEHPARMQAGTRTALKRIYFLLEDRSFKLSSFFTGERFGEIDTLGQVALHPPQAVELCFRLHAFGYDLEAQSMRQANYTGCQYRRPGFYTESTNEGAIDLDVVHREALEVGERRVPCAEVVYDRPHPETLEVLESGCCCLDVAHGGALGDLQEEVARIEADLMKYTGDGVDQIRLPKLPC